MNPAIARDIPRARPDYKLLRKRRRRERQTGICGGNGATGGPGAAAFHLRSREPFLVISEMLRCSPRPDITACDIGSMLAPVTECYQPKRLILTADRLPFRAVSTW